MRGVAVVGLAVLLLAGCGRPRRVVALDGRHERDEQ